MVKKNSRSSSMRARTRAKAQQKKAAGGGGGTKYQNIPQGTEYFKPKQGTMRFDVIPYKVSVDNHPSGTEKGDLWYQRTIYVHYGVGPENKVYLCRKTIGGRCPICEYSATLRKSGEADDDVLKSLNPSERELYNIIDLDDTDKGVQLWEMSYYNFGKLLDDEINEGEDEYGGFAIPDEGLTLKVRFNEKSILKSTYFETTRIDFIERSKQYDDSIVEKAIDLDSILKVLSYDELNAIFMGLDTSSASKEEEEEEEEEEEQTPPKTRKPKVKEEEEEQEEEEEEQTPPKTRKPKVKEKEKGGKCPHNGVFGVDTDNLDDCDTCTVWEECIELKESEQ